MSQPKQIEILISEDGSNMQVLAHNFHGRGCQEVAEALQTGTMVELLPTAEYYEATKQDELQKQDL